MVYVVYGVSGVGKTTIGKGLAKALGLPFYDADDFHSPENVAKMKSGTPLNDDDRRPWLMHLAGQMKRWSTSGGAVLACSALKRTYRTMLAADNRLKSRFIYLKAQASVVAERLAKRENHFMKAELLTSQFETLELDSADLWVDADKPTELIVQDIMENIKASSIGLIGLGVMGSSLARNIASKQFSVSVYNRQTEKEIDVAKQFVAKYSSLAMKGFDDIKLFIESLPEPRNILLMVNAGDAVDHVINDLIPLLDEKDLIIDGGNSHYSDTDRRQLHLAEHKIQFLGMGVSGGEEGALKGPSIMPGGSVAGYHRVASMLNAIAAKDKNDQPCSSYVGDGGSGHFIKMVHNGIEYAEMQLIAELYHLLRFYCGKNTVEIAELFELWSSQGLDSYLLSITIKILRTHENEKPILDVILDKANQKGMGGWSTNAALSLGKPLDSIAQAVMVRCLSAMKDQRLEASNLYPASSKKVIELNLTELKEAYQVTRIINHAIGYDLMNEASSTYDWDLDLAEISRIWTNGCIIRSELMENLVDRFNENKKHLLLHPKIARKLNVTKISLASIISSALLAECPMPVFSATLNYFLGFVSAQSSANMIQAQRDYFGAHTFQRTDAKSDEYFHIDWGIG